MKTVKKEIRIGDLLPTVVFVSKLLKPENEHQEIHGNEKGKQEVLRLMALGLLQSADPRNPYDKTPEEMKEVELSGLAPHVYDIKKLEEKISDEGYHPDKYTYIKVYKENIIIDGVKRFQALNKLYGEDYMVEVEEVIED